MSLQDDKIDSNGLC